MAFSAVHHTCQSQFSLLWLWLGCAHFPFSVSASVFGHSCVSWPWSWDFFFGTQSTAFLCSHVATLHPARPASFPLKPFLPQCSQCIFAHFMLSAGLRQGLAVLAKTATTIPAYLHSSQLNSICFQLKCSDVFFCAHPGIWNGCICHQMCHPRHRPGTQKQCGRWVGRYG